MIFFMTYFYLLFASLTSFANSDNFCKPNDNVCIVKNISTESCDSENISCAKKEFGFEGVEGFLGCPFVIDNGQFKYQKMCLEHFYNNHVFRTQKFTPFIEAISKPVKDRFINFSKNSKWKKMVVDYLTIDNFLYDYPYMDVALETEDSILKEAYNGLNMLPLELDIYINEHFYGFILVKGVGWTGFASDIEANNSKYKPGAVILINADNMKNKTLNDWLEFREKTALTANSKKLRTLKMSYAKAGEKSTVADNFYHFLLHETAHLIAFAVDGIHPHKDYRRNPIPLKDLVQTSADPLNPLKTVYPFLQSSWEFAVNLSSTDESSTTVSLNRILPPDSRSLLAVKKSSFYSEDESKKYSESEIQTLYNQLNDSCFVSLYGTTDFTEDFAETVTHFFMHQQGYEYKISLLDSQGVLKANFEDKIWNSSACRSKVDFVKDLFTK